MALIEVRGLKKYYRMGSSVVRALDGVDLDIERGEFVAVTGASGSGKSTIMHLLGCLDRATSGRFVFDGCDVSELSDRQLADIRNRQIGFVFQTFNLINRTSALENVAVPMFYARRTSTAAPARKALEHVGLSERALHKSNELSGGERQRVAIARAIVNDPLLVLADEPTGNLDSRTGQQIMDLFRTLNEQGVTIVLVTHEYDVAVQTRRIVQMRDGKIVSDRPTEEVLAEDGAVAGHWQVRAPQSVQRVETRAADVPVATARPVGSLPGDPVKEDLGPRRVGRGCSAALVLGILSLMLMAGAIGLQVVSGVRTAAALKAAGVDPATASQQEMVAAMPPGAIGLGLASVGGIVVAIVLGIVGIVTGRRARRRMREEIGNWVGWWRALIGMLLGWLTVLGPVALVAAQLLLKAAGVGT